MPAAAFQVTARSKVSNIDKNDSSRKGAGYVLLCCLISQVSIEDQTAEGSREGDLGSLRTVRRWTNNHHYWYAILALGTAITS